MIEAVFGNQSQEKLENRTLIRKDGEFARLYNQAVGILTDRHSTPQNKKELSEFKGKLLGALFNKAAYESLLQTTPAGHIIYSPRMTFEFVRKILPNIPQVNEPFDRNYLQGLYVPHGMLVKANLEENNVVRVYEYSTRLFDHSMHVSDIIHKTTLFQESRHLFGEHFLNTQFSLVVAADIDIPHKLQEQLISHNIEIVKLPFTAEKIRKEFGNIWFKHRGSTGESANLNEIQRYMAGEPLEMAASRV